MQARRTSTHIKGDKPIDKKIGHRIDHIESPWICVPREPLPRHVTIVNLARQPKAFSLCSSEIHSGLLYKKIQPAPPDLPMPLSLVI